MSIAEFHAACRAVLACPKSGSYAKSYARAGLELQTAEECRVQSLYILSNIIYWRGEAANTARAEFKRLSQPEAWK